eukprot:scaffold110178_cov57-Phaeocystis_antarctica.AAC.1
MKRDQPSWLDTKEPQQIVSPAPGALTSRLATRSEPLTSSSRAPTGPSLKARGRVPLPDCGWPRLAQSSQSIPTEAARRRSSVCPGCP